MADLDDLQAAQTVKIVGSSLTGIETNAVNADANGNLQVIPTSNGSVAPGTVATKSDLIGGQFNTVLPTLTNTQQSAIQVDSNGRILLSRLSDDHNYGAVGANTLRTAAQIGNVTGAADFNAGATTAQTLRTVSNIRGNTDGTIIGNVGDRLKVDSLQSGTWIVQDNSANILKQNEVTISSRNEIDIANTTYTVSSGKSFKLTSFEISYDSQVTVYVRLKKQTGGSGAFNTLFRLTVGINGQDNSVKTFSFPSGVVIGTAGDVFKLTVEAAIIKGNMWAGYTGGEY